MCFLVEINLTREELNTHFGVRVPEDPRYTPGYIFTAFRKPYLPVITNNQPDEIQFFRWGLIPPWVKTTESAEKVLSGTFNARSETIWEKPSFRNAARRKRCLIPVHGFFEWHTNGNKKIPYYIQMKDDKPFIFAGLYENWKVPGTDEILNTFTVITTPANQFLGKIHNIKKRMPAILDHASGEKWLNDHDNIEKYSALLKPWPDDNSLIGWPVSKDKILGEPDIHDPAIVEPDNNYQK